MDGTLSRGHGGSGLGLAICREIVQAHGGRIVAAALAAELETVLGVQLDDLGADGIAGGNGRFRSCDVLGCDEQWHIGRRFFKNQPRLRFALRSCHRALGGVGVPGGEQITDLDRLGLVDAGLRTAGPVVELGQRVAAAGALGVEGVNGAALEGRDRVLDEAALVQRVGVDRDLDVEVLALPLLPLRPRRRR